ncbi:MAG TPA: MmcQ/YjbR family DNA-binding protein [Candidatus Acidoferrum sp.]|nr:MmcQ/YjbR family DNA-binding protein [Candidatus Acidoferrum sp.]
MNTAESIRELCLTFPHATEQIQWGYDLVFKVGGKMFAITPLEPARVFLTVKATDESFAELTERPGFISAPYLARAKWVALERPDAVSPQELASLLRLSYDLVFAKLPRKTRDRLASSKPPRKSPARKPKSRRRK